MRTCNLSRLGQSPHGSGEVEDLPVEEAADDGETDEVLTKMIDGSHTEHGAC
jgi:hypothetical protein